MLWRNGCGGKVLRCGAGNRHQQFLSFKAGAVGMAVEIYIRTKHLVQCLVQEGGSLDQNPDKPGPWPWFGETIGKPG
jgi:hypothetical protein